MFTFRSLNIASHESIIVFKICCFNGSFVSQQHFLIKCKMQSAREYFNSIIKKSGAGCTGPRPSMTSRRRDFYFAASRNRKCYDIIIMADHGRDAGEFMSYSLLILQVFVVSREVKVIGLRDGVLLKASAL